MTEQNKIKVSVENYGPIAEARDIEIGPLTVFVGPSNTGKSYLAVLVYALLRCLYWRGEFTLLQHPSNLTRVKVSNRSLLYRDSNVRSFVEDTLAKRPEAMEFSRLPEELKNWISEQIAEEILDEFHEEISRCMGTTSKKNDLTSGTFRVDFENERQKLTMQSLNKPPTVSIKGGFEFSTTLNSPSFRGEQHELQLLFGEPSGELRFHTLLDRLMHDVTHSLQTVLDPFYLPAGRTGVMQSHRAIAAAFVHRAPFAALEPVSIPTLSGILSDFLASIIQMDISADAPDYDVEKISEKMEADILQGSIYSDFSAQYPQFMYEQNGLEVPLLRSSSMVSELAPIVMYLKHLVKKGDLLIIEEPEAHLHPEAQRGVAKTIVRLVRHGVKVMITTHNDYLLEQLENHVRVSNLSEERRKALVGDAGLYIEPDEINTYWFQQKEQGTVVKKLQFDNMEGSLSPQDHNQISSALYNETVNILDEIEHLQESKGEYKESE